MFPAYIVEYVRLGKEESFITKDQSRAEEYAAQHNGIITPLIKWLNSSDKPCQPSSTINADACCQPAPIAT